MRASRLLLLHFSLGCAILWFAQAAVADNDNTTAHSRFAGVYISHFAGPSMNLPPMVFQPAHDGLQAVTWNRSSWGKVAPPPMKKGFKVKQLYWLTTGP